MDVAAVMVMEKFILAPRWQHVRMGSEPISNENKKFAPTKEKTNRV
jgi:hypothetical protein